MSETRVHLQIFGVVQGVGFRFWAQKTALELGLTGWVKNRDDGGVEAIIEGSEESVQAMLDAARHGPKHSRVENIKIEYQDFSGEFNDFRIVN